MEEKKGLTIVELVAENFRKLKAVRIRPDGTGVVTLTGANGAGKSSILTAILAVFDKGALKKQGITTLLREGAERGFVKVDLGDIVAKLTITPKGEYLTVENAEGMEFKAPASVLEKLRGMISFDPLGFAKMDGKKQREIMLKLVDVGLDLNAHDAERARLFDDRTTVGRDVTALEGKLKGLPPLPEDLPENEIPLTTVGAERRILEDAKLANDVKRKEYQDLRSSYQMARDGYDSCRKEWDEIEEKIQAFQARQKDLFAEGQRLAKEVEETEKRGQGLKAEVEALVDPVFSVLDSRLEEIERMNTDVREKKRREEIAKDLQGKASDYDAKTARIAELDKKKEVALAAAEFPVEGLGFGADGVTFNGLALDEASDGEKLTVSVAIGMALNPELRVLWFNHGEMLDSKHWSIIERLAGEKGYQVWAEKMDESGTVGIFIEDGEIAAVDGGEVERDETDEEQERRLQREQDEADMPGGFN